MVVERMRWAETRVWMDRGRRLVCSLLYDKTNKVLHTE
jgi:hypothetical protein